MNAERLLKHYERIADAPDAIARLHRFILDLAVRGKLVPQDAKDEPASELLKRITKEKAQLLRGRGMKARKSFQELNPYGFRLPPSWSWIFLGGIAEKLTDGSHNPPSNAGRGYAMLSSQNVLDGSISFSNPTRYLVETDFTTENARTRIAPGDVLLTIVGSIGRSAVVPEDAPRFALQRSVAVVSTKLNPEFLCLQFRSPTANAFLTEHGKGTAQKGIYLGKLSSLPIAVPPLAEQHRIVAKVDELMGLCDRLEAARAGREAVRDRLAAASLARLNAPDPETFQADARFALDALAALTTRRDQIKALRQTILNLAVRGKLVPLDPNDKPVKKVVLDVVAKRRGQMRDEIDEPFRLPEGWAWRAVDTLADQVTDGEHATPPRIREAQIPLVTAKNVRDGFMDYSQTDWVSRATAEKAWGRCRPAVGDLLLVCVGATTGRLTVLRAPQDMVLVRSVALIRPNSEVEAEYLERAIRSPVVQQQIWASVKAAAQPCLYINRIQSLVIPLPPLAEQHRIVAKVDELMALCDRLQASLNAAAATRRRLLDALLAEALAPAEDRELEAAE